MLFVLGMILLSDMLIKSNKSEQFLQENKARNFQDIHEIENHYCGIDSISFLGFLFDYWKFDEILIQSIAHIDNPHAASNEIKKNAYALAITNRLFEPSAPFSLFNSKNAIALLNEAKNQEINFDMSNFLANLPQEAKNNLAKEIED